MFRDISDNPIQYRHIFLVNVFDNEKYLDFKNQ